MKVASWFDEPVLSFDKVLLSRWSTKEGGTIALTLCELEKRLVAEGIPNSLYRLNGGLPNEAFCINQNGQKWETYYSERGSKAGLKVFDEEEEACNYFYNWLIESLKDMGVV